MNHTHTMNHEPFILDDGSHFEICDCGASRKVDKQGKPVDVPYNDLNYRVGRLSARVDANGWHTCELCTHEYGRPA